VVSSLKNDCTARRNVDGWYAHAALRVTETSVTA
jgi:hypothetical protein